LKEYASYIDNKEAAGFQEMREVTQKPVFISQPNYPIVSIQGTFKQSINKQNSNIVPAPILGLK